MRVRFEVSGGVDEIRDGLRDGGRVVAERIKEVLNRKADQVVSLARPLTPVEPGPDGGELQASVRKGRANYQSGRGVVSVPIIAGGKQVAQAGHSYNIYAVLQEFDIGKGAPFRHTTGEAHFLERPVFQVGPTIPGELLTVIEPRDVGGA